MPRVSARAPKPISNDELDELAVSLIKVGGPMYCVDLARVAGVRARRARSALDRMERAGKLVSEMKRSPKSGHGRRYFKLVKEDEDANGTA